MEHQTQQAITAKPPRNMDVLKKQYAIMKGKGMKQKDIAKQLGVSENAVSKWAKNLAISGYYVIRNAYQKRLIEMSKDKAAAAIDIYNLTNSLAAIEKIIERYTKA